MRFLVIIALTIISFGLLAQPAMADKRVALVMGNSAYQNVNRLANPTNDSSAMSETLKNAGFDVVELKRDLNANEMRRALRDFSDTVREADVAIVYFAGHGIEIDGTNYVIPVDAVLERDIDAFDEAIPLDRILTVIEPAKQLRLVILDACRDNPFNKTMKRTIGARAVGRGLAKVEPTSPNTLIAFAAKAGSTASDGDSKNSPFTAALVKYLPRPGLDLRKAFGFARDDVLKATNNKQEPFIYGSLGGDDVALVSAVVVTPSATSTIDSNAAVRRDYELSLQIGTQAVWDAFISQYPTGLYADLARAQRSKLLAEQERLQATERAKAASEEKARLAAEGADEASQQKASAKAQSAETARVRAEKLQREREQAVVRAEHRKEKAIREAPERSLEAKKPSSEAAQTTSSTAPTCSKIRDRCLRASSRFGPLISPHLSAHCAPDFAKCMQTGVWHSAYSHFQGVVRR
jgi:Caspase domain